MCVFSPSRSCGVFWTGGSACCWCCSSPSIVSPPHTEARSGSWRPWDRSDCVGSRRSLCESYRQRALPPLNTQQTHKHTEQSRELCNMYVNTCMCFFTNASLASGVRVLEVSAVIQMLLMVALFNVLQHLILCTERMKHKSQQCDIFWLVEQANIPPSLLSRKSALEPLCECRLHQLN